MRSSSLGQDAFLEVDTKGNGAISLDELRIVSTFFCVCFLVRLGVHSWVNALFRGGGTEGFRRTVRLIRRMLLGPESTGF